MKLQLKRTYTPLGTAGVLLLNGKVISACLEDPKDTDGKKDAGIECIPEGVYAVRAETEARWHRSIVEHLKNPRSAYVLGGLSAANWIGIPRLQGVPNYSGIDIHPGNTVTDTLGCLLPNNVLKITPEGIVGQESVPAFCRLYLEILPALKSKSLVIEITGQ